MVRKKIVLKLSEHLNKLLFGLLSATAFEADQMQFHQTSYILIQIVQRLRNQQSHPYLEFVNNCLAACLIRLIAIRFQQGCTIIMSPTSDADGLCVAASRGSLSQWTKKKKSCIFFLLMCVNLDCLVCLHGLLWHNAVLEISGFTGIFPCFWISLAPPSKTHPGLVSVLFQQHSWSMRSNFSSTKPLDRNPKRFSQFTTIKVF